MMGTGSSAGGGLFGEAMSMAVARQQLIREHPRCQVVQIFRVFADVVVADFPRNALE